MSQGPMSSADALTDYLIINLSALPDHLQPRALEAIRAVSPVERTVLGMEALISAVQVGPLPDADAALAALDGAAQQIAASGWWNKQDRAVAVMQRVRFERGEWPDDQAEPAWPASEHSAPSTALGALPQP